MSMTVPELLGAFIDAWQAGARPDVEAYLAQAAGKRDREQLAEQLATWVAMAPAPVYDEPTAAAIAAEPALLAALQEARLQRLELSGRLPLLRERAGLAVRDVAARVTAVFGLDDDGRAADYLGRIERDELDATRVSRRLLDALAAILGADRDLLVPRFAASQTFMRADEDAERWIAGDIDALSRAALAPAPPAAAAPPPVLDELDRLFLGGPDA